MYCLLLLLLPFTHAASSGAATCDALGVCAVTSSGAYNDSNEIKCPWGMHLVGVPTRSNDYMVATSDFNHTGPTEYTPGEIMDIHVRVLNRQKKILGILLYAVQNDGILGVEGCPSPGCDGKGEVKLGTWEEVDKNFRTSCNGQAVTHREANIKNYHHTFRWRAPESGSGDVIFRVLVKQGSTNGGYFYWPMESDLMLYEGGTVEETEKSNWFSGSIDKTCSEICSDLNRECDQSVISNGTLEIYDRIKHSQSCQMPLLSTCAQGPPTRGSSGLCWMENRDSGLCSQLEPTNICDAIEVSGGEERLCPCGQDLSSQANAESGSDSSSSVIIIIVVVCVVLFASLGLGYYFFKREKGEPAHDMESPSPPGQVQIEDSNTAKRVPGRRPPLPPRRVPPPPRRNTHSPPESSSVSDLPPCPPSKI